MAINIDYGGIAAALSAAAQAGANQGSQQRFRNFVDFAGLTQQAQNEVDRRNAQQIQNALGYAGLNERYATSQDQLASQRQMAQAQMNAANLYHNAALGIRQQAVNQSGEYHQTREKQFQSAVDLANQRELEKQQAIANLPPEQQAAVQATGRLPFVPNHPTSTGSADDMLMIRLRDQLSKQIQAEAKYSYDPNDVSKLGQQESKVVPGAVAGQEARYTATQQGIAAIHAQMAAIEARQKQAQANLSPVQAATVNVNAGQVLKNATPQQAPQAQPSGPGSQTMPIHITDDQGYAQLPHGAYFVGPDGQTRIKP